VKTYFDTAVLIKAYITEDNSADADALIQQGSPPIPFSPLHAIETRNALRLKCHRAEITKAQLRGALKQVQADVEAGVLKEPDCDLSEVFRSAEELSAKYAVTTGARTLDILHVAAAQVIGASTFVSFDKRQRAVAQKAGLEVLPP
jgi:predicted nucleic acid-binding protein